MDTGRRIDINHLPPEESNEPWFSGHDKAMPEKMRKEISEELQKVMLQQTGKAPILRSLIRLAGAACLVLFLVFTYEQYHTLIKINQLEARIAKKTGKTPVQTRSQDKLLIINSFISYSDLQKLNIYSDFQNLQAEFLPPFFNSNWFGDKELKLKFSKYLREMQLATKIYMP